MLWNIDKNWSLFLDRDGVINERLMGNYVLTKEQFQLCPKVDQAIAHFNTVFARVLVVTNQQCIEKNLLSHRNLQEIHAYMSDLIGKEGAKVDAVYYAPELASNPLNTRKPKPDMALKAKKDFPEIDFSQSVMVGDTDSDIRFGLNLGMKTVRIRTEEKIGIEADWTVESLFEFSKLLK